MKKFLFVFISALMALSAHADFKVVQNNLKLESKIVKGADAASLLKEGNNNLAYHLDWPEPATGERQQAMLMINWIGLPPEGVSGITVKLDNGSPFKVAPQTQGDLQTWIFIPLSTKSVTLSHPSYGSARVFLKDMNNHDVWSVPVILDKLVNIQIKPLSDYDKSVKVTLINSETGEERSAMSPASFNQVMPGPYRVRFAVDGSNVDGGEILVSPTQTVFGGDKFDLRNFKDVYIESTDKAHFYIDDTYQGEGSNISVRLPFGSHKLSAKVNNSVSHMDEKVVDVNATSPSTIYLAPTETKSFEVVGLYNGNTVLTSIFVSGLASDRYSSAVENKHYFTLPVGSMPYKFNVYYSGHKGSKEITVKSDMNATQTIKISGDRRMVWPWQREYYPANFGWEFSYVAKQYSTSGHLYEDSHIKTTIKENGVWNDGYDHWLHGFRTGFHAQPTLKFGLGFYTGFFMEFYFSGGDDYAMDPYDKYFEMDLSVPVHALYQFPLGKHLAIGFHTGPTFNVAAVGSYYDKFMPSENDYDNVKDWTDFWDEPWAPSRFNITWDFGLYVRWKWLMISGTLSQGMTNNKMYDSDSLGSDTRTVMNKRFVAFSIAF